MGCLRHLFCLRQEIGFEGNYDAYPKYRPALSLNGGEVFSKCPNCNINHIDLMERLNNQSKGLTVSKKNSNGAIILFN